MKNMTNKIILIYILVSLFMAVICHELLGKYFSLYNYPSFSFIEDIIFIAVSGAFLKYILNKKDTKNSAVYNKLKDTNIEIKESNEKYDIVSKATSDIIWDWKILEDNMSWNKGIETIFGYTPDQVGN